jgi:hypothetical protein
MHIQRFQALSTPSHLALTIRQTLSYRTVRQTPQNPSLSAT